MFDPPKADFVCIQTGFGREKILDMQRMGGMVPVPSLLTTSDYTNFLAPWGLRGKNSIFKLKSEAAQNLHMKQ
ncbi:MAG: hypothetical protein ABSH16_02610 [Sedimentisphaerales bacterium]